MWQAYEWLVTSYLGAELPASPVLARRAARRAIAWPPVPGVLPPLPLPFTFLELKGSAARVSVVTEHENLLVSRWWPAPEYTL
jgi:hypothetical protein